MSKKLLSIFGLIMIVSLLLTACKPETIVEKVVETVVVQEVVEGEVVEVVVTATPEPAEPMGPADTSTLTYVMEDDAACLDPHLAYEGTSYEIISNVVEPLIYFNRESASEYIPLLSTNVPNDADGTISEDGLTYTFNIREGVSFHEGGELTASDAAYSFERVLLQSDPNSGAWMMIEAIMGYSSGDITENIAEGAYAGDAAGLIANATPEELVGVCEAVKSHFSYDNEAGTFELKLNNSFGPILSIISRPWAYIIDKEWAESVGDWDGSCDTWQNFYAPGQEGTKLATIINGTGPYKLDHWTPDVEWVIVANEDYWREEGDLMWEDGPSGVASVSRIVHKTVPEWGTRFAMLQTGDAAWVSVPDANRAQVDAFVGETCNNDTGECKPTDNSSGMLRVWPGLPSTSRTDIFLNFNVNSGDTGGNPYIGSGEFDGNGVPADFFSDIHMRKAFSYCFDYDTYIAEAQDGDGVRNNGVIITNMLGYNPDQEMYMFDMDKCAEELSLAWDGQVAEVGFRVQGVTATGYTANQTALAILQSNLRSINPNYKLEIVTLPWASYLAAFRGGILPIAVSGWSEDYHDPHNWAQPFLIGTYATRQNFPEDFKDIFRPLIEQAVAETDPDVRADLYYQLAELRYEYVPEVNLSQAGVRHYEQRWVKGYFYNPVANDYYYYGLEISAE